MEKVETAVLSITKKKPLSSDKKKDDAVEGQEDEKMEVDETEKTAEVPAVNQKCDEKKLDEKQKELLEPAFHNLSNPTRAVRLQLRALNMPESSPYKPIKPINYGGIVMSQNTDPNKTDETVELAVAGGMLIEEAKENEAAKPHETGRRIEADDSGRMCQIETYIFMDFETTGLFDDGQNNPLTNPNRCNETTNERAQRLDSLVKSERREPLSEDYGVGLRFRAAGIVRGGNGEGVEPVQVVSNVHVRQVNPQLNAKEWAKYEELQRKVPSILLRESDLACKNTFGQEWPGVAHLLQTAPKPACLIAHNGVNFDFRILCHELRKNDLLRSHPFPERVYFLDSLSCFYELEREYNREMELTMENVDWNLVLSQFQPNAENSVKLEMDSILENGTASAGQATEGTANGHQSTTILHRLFDQKCSLTADGNVFPNSQKAKYVKGPLFKDDIHPIQFMRQTQWSPAKRRCIDAKFFESNNRGEWSFNGNHSRRLLCGRGKFKLENMFKMIFSAAQQFHRAQSDCDALLQVCLAYGMDFVKGRRIEADDSGRMCQIETYIFMDFETTGLFDDGQNNPLTNPNRCNETTNERAQRLDSLVKSGRTIWAMRNRVLHQKDGNRFPKITELAFVSVPRALFVEAMAKVSSRHLSQETRGDGEGVEPVQVVSNVHVRQVNPQLNAKEWAKYEELQRKVPSILLRESDLACKNTFGQEWPGVAHLLQTAPKPACLIAHNGVNFDFRILCHELRKNDLLRSHPFPERVYFLDSLSCFYELEREYNREMELTMENVDWNLVLSQFQPNAENSVKLEMDSILENGTASAGQATEGTANGHQSTTILHRLTVQQSTPIKNADETTISSNFKITAKRSLFKDNIHPIQFMRQTQWSPAKRRCIDAKFFESNNRGEWSFNGNHSRRLLCGRGKFKLENMFKMIFSAAQQFHRAQSDCDALLQVCLAYGMDFVKFADRNCSPFPGCFETISKKTPT
uniref:26S proteasome regulatory subunit RPN2 C-terminal domain-containing protein n=1 Tax=Globodera rostochiensis TaxID=31243 RepID=A0A914HZH6_GLORO